MKRIPAYLWLNYWVEKNKYIILKARQSVKAAGPGLNGTEEIASDVSTILYKCLLI